MEKEPLGLLLYGYNRKHADIIVRRLREVLGDEIMLMSASNREDETVGDILGSVDEGGFTFEERETRFAMLLGFSEPHIRTTLKEFPADGGLKRPIFTTLTENNVKWPVSRLIEDLEEEEAYWAKKRKEAAEAKAGGQE